MFSIYELWGKKMNYVIGITFLWLFLVSKWLQNLERRQYCFAMNFVLQDLIAWKLPKKIVWFQLFKKIILQITSSLLCGTPHDLSSDVLHICSLSNGIWAPDSKISTEAYKINVCFAMRYHFSSNYSFVMEAFMWVNFFALDLYICTLYVVIASEL